jgi:hypothetical protein
VQHRQNLKKHPGQFNPPMTLIRGEKGSTMVYGQGGEVFGRPEDEGAV